MNTVRAREMWKLWWQSKKLRATARLAPNDEQRQQQLREAERLFEQAQQMSEDEERSRETEAAIKARPGGYYDPKDGPL